MCVCVCVGGGGGGGGGGGHRFTLVIELPFNSCISLLAVPSCPIEVELCVCGEERRRERGHKYVNYLSHGIAIKQLYISAGSALLANKVELWVCVCRGGGGGGGYKYGTIP